MIMRVFTFGVVIATATVAAVAACTSQAPTTPRFPSMPEVSGDTVTTDSGLRYIDIEPGEGDAAQRGNIVSVHYSGWLEDGTGFDSSRGRDPLRFTLGTGGFIDGFTEGVAGMRVGGERRLIIPPELGYGSGGRDRIPPNATLIFDLELVDLQRRQ